jgi:predicted Zn-dependent protease
MSGREQGSTTHAAQVREALFQKMVADFPDSAMAHFSLGGFYMESRKWPEAIASLLNATRLQPDYAAAWVALGDAYAASADPSKAREAYGKARGSAFAQGHQGLAEEIDRKVAGLQ